MISYRIVNMDIHQWKTFEPEKTEFFGGIRERENIKKRDKGIPLSSLLTP